jgi:hypothetical protein
MSNSNQSIIRLIAVLVGVVLATRSGHAATTVLPNPLATEDYDFGAGTLSEPNYRNQQVYHANQFPSNVILITEIRFRPDRTYGNAFSATTISNIQINMSTTTNNPGSLSSTFANNVGADDKIVLSGAVSVSSQFTGPSQGPKAFDIVIPLECPFRYDPSLGNLVVDSRNFSGSAASLLSGSTYYTLASRVGGNTSSSTGTADQGADALQIVYGLADDVVVPNPLATEDYDFGAGTLSEPNYRNQQVYHASGFPSNVVWITELRFRPDRTYGNAFSTTTISNIQINMSTTTNNPGSLSSTFANNVGPDDTIVLDGAVAVSSQFSGPSQGPKAFDIVIPLECPFRYDPSLGNLVVDIRNFSGSAASLLSGSTYYTLASRVGGTTSSSTGTADQGADALKVIYFE